MTVSDGQGADLKGLEPLLSIDDVARLLRVSESSVYRLVRNGELARVKVGGRTLFEPKTVRAFIAGCREATVSHTSQDHPTNMPDSTAEASQHA
jgi:excisionase family DNA binding protein